MRISDWSSDVCSSDLVDIFAHQPRRQRGMGFFSTATEFQHVAQYGDAPAPRGTRPGHSKHGEGCQHAGRAGVIAVVAQVDAAAVAHHVGKSVVWGNRVVVGLVTGGLRLNTKKKK